MSESYVLLKIVEIASSLAEPLSLAGLIATLFFFTLKYIINRLPIESVTNKNAYKLLALITSYGFILALVGLVLGVLSYIFSNYVAPQMIRDGISNAALSENHERVIELSIGYLKDNPKDLDIRHILGTSYYTNSEIDKGIDLYKDAADLYRNEELCSFESRTSLSSLAAFYILKRESKIGLEVSTRIRDCDGFNDGEFFNHAKLMVMSGAKTEEIETMLETRELNSTYSESLYNLLLYVSRLKQDGMHTEGAMRYLKEAYCENNEIISLIQLRFNSGDIKANPITTHDFDYELDVMNDILTLKIREDIEKKLRASSCINKSL